MAPVSAAVVLPVKAFASAKGRLAGVLTPNERDALVRWTAARVVRAAGELPVFVACDDDEVAEWASSCGAEVVRCDGLGLNGAVDHAVTHVGALGIDHVVVVHADLPLPGPRHVSLSAFARPRTITLVPDRSLDGTNLMSMPTGAAALAAAYGTGSFHRHLAAAMAIAPTAHVAVEVVRDPVMAIDIDHPLDLHHPLVRPLLAPVIPTWQPTNQANPFPHR